MTMEQNTPSGTGAGSTADLGTPASGTTSTTGSPTGGSLGSTGSTAGSGASFGTGASGSGSSDPMKDAASRVVDKVGTQVESTAGQQFGRAGSMLDHVADALDKASQDMRSQEPPIADVAKMAASQVRGVADYVRDADLDTLRQNAMDFARRQPAAFLGGAMVLGLMASRFLKASGSSGGSSMGRGYGGSSGYRTSGFGSSNYGYGSYGGYGASGYGDRGSNGSGSRGGVGSFNGYGTAVGPGRASTAGSSYRSGSGYQRGVDDRGTDYGTSGRGTSQMSSDPGAAGARGQATGEYGGAALDTGDLGGGQTTGNRSGGRSGATGQSGQGGTYGRS